MVEFYKTFKKISMLTLLLFCLSGFVKKPNESTFNTNRVYESKLNIEGFCVDGKRVKKGQLVNCVQRVEFNQNGSATILVTDIMNIGTYSIIEGKIYSYFDNNSDSLVEMIFLIQDDGLKLVDNIFRKNWLLLDEQM